MGRPSTVRPPPPALKGSGYVPGLLQAADLEALPQTRKRSYVAGADLAAAAGELNKWFDRYALGAAARNARAPRHEVRDWCHQVARQAGELTFALGLDRRLQSGQHEDALLHLAAAWPHPEDAMEGAGREWYARHTLDRLVGEAQPELLKATQRDGAHDPRHEVAWKSIGARLAAALGVLQLLATRAGDYNASRVAKGGTPQEARKRLFCNLSGSYERLFGCLPGAPSHTRTTAEEAAGEGRSTLPKGPALEWYRALLRLIGTRAGEMLSSCGPGSQAPDADRAALLGELMSLAAAAAKSRAADGLAHWIREGSAERAQRGPEPPPEAVDPDFTPTPLDEIFG
jgi:hypothetical protein